MPPAAHDPLAALLRRTRRRFTIARLGEAAFVGVTALLAAGAATRAIGLGGRPAAIACGGASLLAVAVVWRPPPTPAGAAAWLDERHGLADLLASAWATRHRRGELWAVGLAAVAAARAAALPPAGRLGRFSARRMTCTLAAAAAAWLAAGLVFDRADTDIAANTAADTSTTRIATRPADRADIADAVRRRADTSDSTESAPLPRPSPADPTQPGRATQPSRGLADAAGLGRADALRVAAPPTYQEPGITKNATSPGGSGRAAGATVMASGAGEVSTDPRATPAVATGAAGSSVAPHVRTTLADPPAAYRDLVQDFFAR